ncbi:MAG TPA: chorismate-binding protein, partial [Vampirovibrionales bacterium]
MPFSPSISGFKDFVQQGYNLIPICKEVLVDLETPVSCYLKVQERTKQSQNNKTPSFLLESVEGGERLGRYSIIGLNPAGLLDLKAGQVHFETFWNDLQLNLNLKEEPFECLDELIKQFKIPLNLFPFITSGIAGAIAYDTIRFIEPLDKLKVDKDFPEIIFLLIGDLIVFDNLTKKIKLITNIFIDTSEEEQDVEKLYSEAQTRLEALEKIFDEPIPELVPHKVPMVSLQNNEVVSDWESSFTKDEYIEIVERAKEHIKAGDIFQIVPSQQMKRTLPKPVDPFYIYRILRSLNPSPYLFFFDFGEFQLVGSSPEVMVKSSVADNGDVNAILRPIAGTYRRGKSNTEDERLAKKLKEDPKELAEHLMLIDLARNDLGRVAVPGSVHLTDLMFVEKYSHVLHLVSEVECKLRKGISPIQVLKAAFPAGTLSGAPKVRAMQIISEFEKVARGF